MRAGDKERAPMPAIDIKSLRLPATRTACVTSGTLVFFVLLVQMFLPAFGQTDPATANVTTPQYTEDGPKQCLLCHSGLRMELMSETLHGDVNNPDAPFGQKGCESCHGPGGFHVTRSRRGKGRPGHGKDS